MKRKWRMQYSVALLLCMLLLTVTVGISAYAEDANTVKPDSWEELQQALAEGKNVKLDKDIVFTVEEGQAVTAASSALKVPKKVGDAECSVVLDLNGYTIDRNLIQYAGNDTEYSNPKQDGYVILVEGSLTLKDSSAAKTGKITGGYNSTVYGGGIGVKNGTLIMEGGIIEGNTAYYGGGVSVIGANARFEMVAGTIRYNAAVNGGNGGGIYVEDGKVVLRENAVITENTSIYANGGGIYACDEAEIEMNGGIISKNFANASGGGIYLGTDSVAKLYGGEIVENKVWYKETTEGIWNPNKGAGVFCAGTVEPYTGGSAADDNSKIYLKGDITVKDNVEVTGAAYAVKGIDNIYMQNHNDGKPEVMAVVGELSGCIGILTEGGFAEGIAVIKGEEYTVTDADAAVFFYDDKQDAVIGTDGMTAIKKVQIPAAADLLGKSETEVVDALKALGFNVEVRYESSNGEYVAGNVFKVEGAGQVLTIGSTVIVYVSNDIPQEPRILARRWLVRSDFVLVSFEIPSPSALKDSGSDRSYGYVS